MSNVAIFIPAMRVQNFERIVQNLAETTSDPYAIYWMIETDEEATELDRLEQFYWRDEGGRWGHRLQFLYENTKEQFMFLGADDLLWHPDWLIHAMCTMKDVRGVVSVNDLWQHGVGTSALVDRDYIDTMSGCVDEPGMLIHPGYFHFATETELFETAMSRGRYAYCAESVVEHLHFTLDKSPIDDVYRLPTPHTQEDVDLYHSRKHLWA